MKIGILTFHRAVNYGACLQAFALKGFLENKGYEVDIIDYRSNYIEGIYNNPLLKGTRIKTKIKNIITWSAQKKRNQKFKEFVRTYLKCSEENSLYTKDQLKEAEKKYDKIIVGSDQVWNTLCTGNDTVYYLDFIEDNSKKFSYAASFGIVNNEYYELENLKKLLKEFNKISVREKKGADILEKMTGIKAPICLDPTFLMSRKDWINKIDKINRKNYVLVYSLSMPKSIVDYAEKLAKQKNMDVIYFTLNNLFSIKEKRVINGSPMEFLSYFENADYVITNSFHGTAFSLIFNKNFTIFKNANKNHDNSRLENILSLVNLENRMINEGEEKFFEEEINYKIVNDILNKKVDESKKYIDEILGDGYESKY